MVFIYCCFVERSACIRIDVGLVVGLMNMSSKLLKINYQFCGWNFLRKEIFQTVNLTTVELAALSKKLGVVSLKAFCRESLLYYLAKMV